MSEWKKVKLGELCKNVTSGGTPKSSIASYYYPSTIPWLKTKEVNYNRIYETENHISDEGLRNSSAKLIPSNSIIVAMYGQGDTAGRVAINKIPVTTNQACCNLTIDENKADYEFVYYNLCTLYDKLVSLKNGGAQPNLNAGIIKNLEISIPSLPIQHRIATILSRYDSLIENYQKQIKLLEEAAQRLYKEWFIDLHFPGHENTTIINGIPEEWEKKKILEVYEFKYGKILPTKEFIPTGNIPVYGASKVIGYYDKANCNECKVLVGSRGNAGFVHRTLERESYVTNNSFIVNPLECYQYIKLPYIYVSFLHMDFVAICTGAAQPQLTLNSINSLTVTLPSQAIIEKYCSIAQKHFDRISYLHRKITKLTEARDRLLPKLMSGEIKV